MLHIFKKLHELQQSSYDPGRDRTKLLELYDEILNIANDRDAFLQASHATMQSLTCNALSDKEEKQWLCYAGSIYASYAAVKLYEGATNKTVRYSPEETEQLAACYLDGAYAKEVTSAGLYACAQHLSENAPMRCYELTEQAFTLNPKLADVLGIPYCYTKPASEDDLTKTCPFCGSGKERLTPHYCSPQIMKAGKKHAFPPAKLWIKCNECENYFTYRFPKSRTSLINGHYTKKDGDALENKFSLSHYGALFDQFRKLASGNDYLEIGVGTGEMLAVAQEYGYQVDAVEICREDCERISSILNIDISWCDVLDYETDKQYDVIVMGDVLEHVIHPVRLLEKAKHMLKQEGILWISTPNYNSAYARMQKFSHCMWHELNHYTYVSYESLKRLLETMQMEVVHYAISSRYIGSMELIIRRRKA